MMHLLTIYLIQQQPARHPAPVTSMPMLLNPAYNPIQAAAAAMAAGIHRPQMGK